ncbi:MAG: hypothetical protein H6492_02940 [Candidatus Paracaedibacteraceae bacterium]|nr:hypothetical protein [Candidatus Paracaedibacteraceae bacterium]
MHLDLKPLVKDRKQARKTNFQEVLSGLVYSGKKLVCNNLLSNQAEFSLVFDDGEAVSGSQVKKWNDMFIEALSEDKFFWSLFDLPFYCVFGSGMGVNTRSLPRNVRLGDGEVDLSEFRIDGVSGNIVNFNLPIFVHINGDISKDKKTDRLQSVVAYRIGDTVIGFICSYANQGYGFGVSGQKLETSLAISRSFKKYFLEGESGFVFAKELFFSEWSGKFMQLKFGYDFNWISPFIQLTRQNVEKYNNTQFYIGIDAVIKNWKADTYSIDSRLLAMMSKKNAGSFIGVLDFVGSITLNDGISFHSNININSVTGCNFGLSIKLER